MNEEQELLRPNVRKYQQHFEEYIREYGSETVRKVLMKGHHENIRITFAMNRKDRFQMLQLLGLDKESMPGKGAVTMKARLSGAY
jgi:hypothetical protein